MPIIDGIGVSKLTAIKEKHFRMIVSMHLRIVKGILSRNSWADQKYWYIDMNAGQGYNRIPDSDQVVMGSPVQFLEAAIESSSKFRAIFVERDKKSALKLTCIVKGIDPSAHVINSDHAMVARALCEYEPSGPPPFGMLYSDPNDFIPWDAIGSISNLDRFSKLDVLLHVPATTLKRVRHLEGYPTLVEGMRKIKKTHWLIRNPLGANQFTFLIGTNWDAFPLLKGLGFHNLDTPDGQEVLNHLNFTEKQLKKRMLSFSTGVANMSQIIVDHEIESLLPPLSPEKRGQLEENIKAHGCLDPLKIWRGHNVLLDGHNRFEICSRNGIPYQVSELEFGERSDALWWVIRNQFGRRDLTVFQRAELALRVEHIIKGIAKENLSAGADETNKKRWADSKSSPLQNSAKAINRRSNNKHHEVMSSDLSCDSSSVLKQDVDDHDVREDVATSCSHETQKDQPITTISPAEPTITPVDTRAELAKLAGISHDTMAKAKLISEHAPEPLKEQVRSGEVSINKAAQETKKIVHEDLEFGAPTTLPSPRKAAVPTFNKTNDNIEWAKFSWNPVTGCKHGCRYCYARDIANRFEGTFEPQFREERLSAPMNTKVPEAASRDIGYRNVFVCSMADLFGEWVPDEWIEKVMMACADSPQWNYLFLTKNPSRLPDVFFPTNAWVGTTVDTIARIQPAIEAMSKVNASVRFLSCEPMLEPLTFPTFECFDWIIIGGQSQSTGCPEFQPQWSWVSKLSLSAQEAGLKVYWKPNLRPDRPREYPVLQ